MTLRPSWCATNRFVLNLSAGSRLSFRSRFGKICAPSGHFCRCFFAFLSLQEFERRFLPLLPCTLSCLPISTWGSLSISISSLLTFSASGFLMDAGFFAAAGHPQWCPLPLRNVALVMTWGQRSVLLLFFVLYIQGGPWPAYPPRQSHLLPGRQSVDDPLVFLMFSSFQAGSFPGFGGFFCLAAKTPPPPLPTSINRDHPRPVFPAGPQPRAPDASVPHRTSTATIHAQCSLPDLNRELQTQVFPAVPQPRPTAPSVPCRTSTASSRPKCSLPDLNHSNNHNHNHKRNHTTTKTITNTQPQTQSQTQPQTHKHNHKHNHKHTTTNTQSQTQTQSQTHNHKHNHSHNHTNTQSQAHNHKHNHSHDHKHAIANTQQQTQSQPQPQTQSQTHTTRSTTTNTITNTTTNTHNHKRHHKHNHKHATTNVQSQTHNHKHTTTNT